MIWHPVVISTVMLDIFTAILLFNAALKFLRIAAGWQPMTSNRVQLCMEADAESASIQARWVFAVFLASSGLFVVGISNIFPDLVPGAMCGTGVMQAGRNIGLQAVVLRVTALIGLHIFRVLEKCNQRVPNAPITEYNSRFFLLIVPFVFLAMFSTFQTFYQMDIKEPVSCCAIVYEPLESIQKNGSNSSTNRIAGLSIFFVTGIIVFILSLKMRRDQSIRKFGRTTLLVIGSIVWTPAAYHMMLTIFAAYYFQVLHHRCLWCLFLPENYRVGFMLVGVMLVVPAEVVTAVLLKHVAKTYPVLADIAGSRVRSAGLHVAVAELIFIALTLGPAISWRLRYGVWMG